MNAGMIRARRVSEFPWRALDRLDAPVERTLHSARRWLELGVRPEAYARALSSVVETEVVLQVLSVDHREPEIPLIRLGLSIHDGPGRCVVGVEPALAGALLAKLLRRPVPMMRADAPLDPTLLGALSALLLESARRTHASRALLPCEASVTAGSAVVHVAVIVDGRPHAAVLWILPALQPAPELPEGLLERISEAELALPLIVAENLGEVGQLARLVPGSAWCPGAGWLVNERLEGRGILAAGGSDCGLGVELGPGPRIVLRQPTSASLAAPDSMASQSEDSSAPTLTQAVLDAPLVVRVELGSVSMKAREWAQLRPGDVLETGRRIAEPVLLRAGGRVLARGELVNIEGELGVRVTELLSRGEP